MGFILSLFLKHYSLGRTIIRAGDAKKESEELEGEILDLDSDAMRTVTAGKDS